MRTWTALFQRPALVWRFRFNGDTALRPWTECGPVGGAKSPDFNGDTALRPWTARRGSRRNCSSASMEPRPCGRGRSRVPVGLPAAAAGFNGATALRPWTACPLPWPCARARASMGPRPCGRGRRAVHAPRRSMQSASMGPRPCGRGRVISSDSRRGGLSGFNGATALRPWTGVCGVPCVAATDLLQWGHGLVAVDGSASGGSFRKTRFASMGPRPCGRGRRARRSRCSLTTSFNL